MNKIKLDLKIIIKDFKQKIKSLYNKLKIDCLILIHELIKLLNKK